MASRLSIYEEKIVAYTEQSRIIQKKISKVALFRLISFSTFAIALYLLLERRSYLYLSGALLMLTVYVILVNRSHQLKNRRALLEKLLFINTNELGILQYKPNGLPDGQPFLTNESYLDDLDIFGKGSLFHLLNRTTSRYGTATLAALLRQPLRSAGHIREQQEAIQALSAQLDKRQLIIANGLMTDEKAGSLDNLVNWLETSIPLFQQKWVTIALWAIVVYNSFFLIFWVIGGNNRPLVAGILFSWILNGLHARLFSRKEDLTKKNAILDQYATTLRLFNTMDNGKSVMLEQLQAQTSKAHQAIRRLARLSDYLDRQLNPYFGLILNSLFVYNLRGQVALEKWKQANKKDFPEWIDAVGRIECLNSLAGFAFNNPDYSYPSPTTGSPLSIEATKMAHPLLPLAVSVGNDLMIGRNDRMLLVTGSNMSGKTTFLRTVGVNLLLAQCGAPVCAASFSFTPMQILSSLRISDSLQESTSYFMAELKKLQQIIHGLQGGQPALVLIDEILRGTNSEDKTYGSEQFIRKLLQYPCLSLFATHDLSLGKLEEEQGALISNYCFESVIEQGALHFDYRLQRGIARNRNASFLMEKMEII